LVITAATAKQTEKQEAKSTETKPEVKPEETKSERTYRERLIQQALEPPFDILNADTVCDAAEMITIAKICKMSPASVVFARVNGASRLQQFTLVCMDEDPSNPRDIIWNHVSEE